MTLTNIYNKFYNCLYFGARGISCLIFTFLISSCQQKKPASAGYSAAFKPILDTVSVLFATNRLVKGLHYLDSSINNINKPTIDDRFKVYAFHYIYAQKAKNDYKKALLYADSMLSLANQSVTHQQYVSNYAEANFAMGDAYFSMQQFDDAYQHFFQGYIVGKNNLNNGALSEYTYRMGMIMYKTGNYKLATGYFKESYRLHADKGDKFIDFYYRQELLDNIALSFKHNNEIDSAIVYFNKALKFIDQYGPQFKDRLKMIDMARGVVYGNKAEILILKGNYKEAKELLKKSIAINLKRDYDNSDAELGEIKLARIYFNQNKNRALFNLLNTIRTQLANVKNKDVEADWNNLMSEYYLHKKDPAKAYQYLQTYNRLKDSNIKKLNLLRESNINKQFDSYEKQSQIDSLKNYNKLQSEYLYAAIICALMALIIIFLIFKNWNRSKKDIQIVNTLNQQINDQNKVLENALNEIKSNSREKDRILRTVAHDLRNPLGGIASLTAIMVEDECTDEQKEQINLIRETSINALELINEILEAANIASVQLKLELVEVNSLISNSVGLLRFKAAEKSQQIFLQPLNREQELYISREKIWRVISNLISNAIKFSPTGASIFVSITKEPGQVIIAVEDNGIGIPENLKDQVFNMFTSAQRAGTAGEKSFGLGLSICRQIIEKFNGKIWFESKNEGGTIFFISLPASTTGTPAASSQKVSIPVSR
ncbi:MAG: walK 3 [Mucilaginibacter sp.]|nr:walK 3 [Mucilaginibacter sp.]